MPTLDAFGDYLAAIDWVLAVVVAVISIAVAAVLKRFLEPAADEFLRMMREARVWLGRRALERRPNAPETRWACPVCRSINPPAATVCYRGCGPRPIDAATPSENAAEELAAQRGGRTGRRGW